MTLASSMSPSMAAPAAELCTLSLHDALPILFVKQAGAASTKVHLPSASHFATSQPRLEILRDRKSTRLNSSHRCISYAVFCLKNKTTRQSLSLVGIVKLT